MDLLTSSRRLHPFALGALVFCTLALSTGTGLAQDSAENKAAARDLALDGIKLAQAGDCKAAIPKLRRAEKLYHAPTILTWIGECLLQRGRYVEGTEVLRRVVREKLEANAPEAYFRAQEKSQKLINDTEGKIGKLIIHVESGGNDLSGMDGLEVFVNGKAISNALVGAARPTDPGEHQISAEAPGHSGEKQTVLLSPGETIKITLVLEPADQTVPSDAPADSTAPPQDQTQSTRSGDVLAWSLVGGGAALVAGGGVAGFLAISKKNDLSCTETNQCASREQDTLDAANLNATLSTLLFGVGSAVAITGVILLLTGEKDAPSATVGTFEVTPLWEISSLGIHGTF